MYSGVKRVPLKLKGSEDKRQKLSGERKFHVSAAATLPCTGRVVVSGTTIQGLDSKFKEEVEIGDTLIITNPQTHQVEERKVMVVMTNRSLVISEKLSSDFVSTVTMEVRKDSVQLRREVEAQRKANEANKLKKEDPDQEDVSDGETLEAAMKRQLDKNMKEEKMNVSFKQKTGTWGYKTVTEKVDRNLSREDILDFRSKRVHDKYC